MFDNKVSLNQCIKPKYGVSHKRGRGLFWWFSKQFFENPMFGNRYSEF
jgi:hypothetical protein